MRIRTVKPEFWTDEKIGECSPSARLLFVGCLCVADDAGNLERSARQLKAQVFPYDQIDCEPLLQELLGVGLVVEYEANGAKYLSIKHFHRHQKIDKPSKARCPFPEGSPTTPRVLDEDSPTPRPGREGKGKEGSKDISPDGAPAADAAAPIPVPIEKTPEFKRVLDEIWRYYIAAVGKNPVAYSFTQLRRKKGAARLTECLAKVAGNLNDARDLMTCAIDNLTASDFHMGRDAKTNGRRYCDWESHLFPSQEQLEKWLQK